MSRHACGAKCAYSRKRPSSRAVQPAAPWPAFIVCASASSASRASRCVVKTAWKVPGACARQRCAAHTCVVARRACHVRAACVPQLRACQVALAGWNERRRAIALGRSVAWSHGRRWRFPAEVPQGWLYRAMGQPRASTPPRSVVAAAQGSTNGAAIQQALVKVARVRHADRRAPARIPSLQLRR